MLNEEGLRHLIAGTFDASDPDKDLLCAQHERPAGHLSLGPMWGAQTSWSLEFRWRSRRLVDARSYKDADLLRPRAVTQDGKRLLETMGFSPGPRTFENLAKLQSSQPMAGPI